MNRKAWLQCPRCGFVSQNTYQKNYHEGRCQGHNPEFEWEPTTLGPEPFSNDDGGGNHAGPSDLPGAGCSYEDDGLAHSTSSDEDEDNSSDQSRDGDAAFQEHYAKSTKTFEQFGESKCSFDFAQFIYKHSLPVTAGDELYSLLKKHKVDTGKGIYHKVPSTSSILLCEIIRHT